MLGFLEGARARERARSSAAFTAKREIFVAICASSAALLGVWCGVVWWDLLIGGLAGVGWSETPPCRLFRRFCCLDRSCYLCRLLAGALKRVWIMHPSVPQYSTVQ